MKTSIITPRRRKAKSDRQVWFGKHEPGCVCCQKQSFTALMRQRSSAYYLTLKERIERFSGRVKESVKEFVDRRFHHELALMFAAARRLRLRIRYRMPTFKELGMFAEKLYFEAQFAAL